MCDPNISCNGCILKIKGLDLLLLEKDSNIQNEDHQTESQWNYFQNLDVDSEDEDDVPAPWQTTTQQPLQQQKQFYTTRSGRQIAAPTNLTYNDAGEQAAATLDYDITEEFLEETHGLGDG